MLLKKFRFVILLALNCICFWANATVDSLDVPSASMNKIYKAGVVLPASYAKNKAAYPVLYLLHGGGGHFRSWLIQPPNKQLVQTVADQFNIIIVMPEGEPFGWYLDSPFNLENKFETHVINEVIPKIDQTYRTVKNKKGRVITGLSMGGHGAMYLSTRHPDLFCAAGSMSGALDMNFSKYRIDKTFNQTLKERYLKLLGTDDPTTELFTKNSVINMIDKIKQNGLAITIDCGVDDFLLDVNREFHNRLVYNNIPHDYTERPGAHTWEYWENSLPYHVLFFYKILKNNGVIVE